MLGFVLFIAGIMLVGFIIERVKINTVKKMSKAEYKQFSKEFRLQYNTPKKAKNV